jgi:hypothetical protein
MERRGGQHQSEFRVAQRLPSSKAVSRMDETTLRRWRDELQDPRRSGGQGGRERRQILKVVADKLKKLER